MAIVTCEHHSGIGLCDYCRRQQDASYERERYDRGEKLRANADLLRRAANVLQEAGEYHLAEQIRQKVGR